MIGAVLAWLSIFVFLTTIAGDENLNKFRLSNCEFTLQLLKTLAKDGDNVLVSPISISILLALLQQGAKGNSAQQLTKVLGLDSAESNTGYSNLLHHLEKTKSNTVLEWGNRGYVRPDFPLDEHFQRLIQANFKADMEYLNFGPDSAAQINNWVANVTHDKIKDLVSSSSLNADTVMLLVNAIYFKGLWSHPFHVKRTKPSAFRLSQQNEVNVPFMHQVEEYIAGENTTLGAKWVELTFSKDEYSMVFVLPTEDHKLDELVSRMTHQDLLSMLSSTNKRNVRLRLPKFQLSKKLSLTKPLTDMGVEDIFTDRSDLSGMSPSRPIAVSDIVHQATIEVNEEGSTASAATAGFVYVLSLDWNRDEMSFNANQPFLLFIQDTTHRTPLFVGKVRNPTS